MSEIWEPPLLFRTVKENRNVYLYNTNKKINNKFLWTYSTNDCQSPLIFMVKICRCCSCTIYWYPLQLALFHENYIALWPSVWYYYSCDNMMTQRTSMKKEKTTPNIYFNWINNTINIHTKNSVQVSLSCKLNKSHIRSDHVLVDCEKVKIRK